MFDNDEERDDLIRLFDMEQNRVFSCTMRKEIIVEDFSENEDNKLKVTLGSDKNISSTLPAAFYDIDSNVELLKRCRPLSIKLIDSNKFPSYNEKSTNSNKRSHHNSKKILQEPDCIEISSSDENDSYDIIVERNVSKDIGNINEEFRRSRIIRDSVILENKSRNTETNRIISSWQNNNTLLVKNNGNSNTVLEGYSAENFDINGKITYLASDNTPLSKKPNKNIQDYKQIDSEVTKKLKRRRNSKIFTEYAPEETYIDKIDAYARLIDKANTDLQRKEKPLLHNKYVDTNYNVTYCEDQNIIKPYVTNKLETLKSKNDNNNIEKCINNYLRVEKNASSIAYNIQNEDYGKKAVDKSSNNNFKQVLRTKSDNDIIMRLYRDRKNETKSTFDELSQKNRSGSPILPCPPHSNKSDNSNTQQIGINVPLSSVIKSKIEKEFEKGACANPFYSANRIIPHYHNETIQRTQNISKKLSAKLDNILKHNENAVCKGNYYFPNQIQLKQNKTVNDNFKDFSNIGKNDKKTVVNILTSTYSDISNTNKNNYILYNNYNQEPYKFSKSKESLDERINIANDSVTSLEANSRTNSEFSGFNKIPVTHGQKLQYPYCNEAMSTFPYNAIISDRDNFQFNDFSLNSNGYNVLPHPQNFIQNGVNPNYVNNNVCNTDDNLNCTSMLQASVDFNEYKRLCESRKDLVTTNKLPQHQIGNAEILNTPFRNYFNNSESNLHVNNRNRHKSKLHESLQVRANDCQKRSLTSTSDNKFSKLKTHLGQAILKINLSSQDKFNFKNKNKINKTRLNRQNEKVTLISDRNFNTDKEKVIAADYVTEKASRKEENPINKFCEQVNVCKDKHIRQLLNQPCINSANGRLRQSDSQMHNLVISDHSQPHYLIPRQ